MISVFGSTGFIGSNWTKMYPDISFPEERDSLIPKYDKILYLRSTVSNYNVFADPSLDVSTNLLLFTKTLDNTSKNCEFNLISSWFVETGMGFYSITKRAQEELLESYSKTFDRKYKIIRLSNVISGDSKANKKKNALEHMINEIKNNKDIEIYEGTNFRNFINVSDCCRAIKLILDKGENGQKYNVGDLQSYRIQDLLEYCIDKTKSKSKISIVPIPRFHSLVQCQNYWMETEKLKKLGFKAEKTIWQTLDEICSK
jgi:nucleoside-diphosphate-sugar epimerase